MPLSYKAGRLFRQERSNTVQADPAKGTLAFQLEDDLLHLTWQARPSNGGEPPLDLIIFPGDASFTKCAQSGTDNVFVLKFSSSQESHFFYFQAADAPYDTFAQHISAIIDDPEFSPAPEPVALSSISGLSAPSSSTSAIPATPAPAAPSSQVPSAPNPRRTAGFSIAQAEGGGYTPEQLAQLQALLEGQAEGTVAAEETSDVSLTDILTPTILAPILSHPALLSSLFPHLPSDLPISNPPTQAEVTSVVQSAQFQQGVASLDRALRTGQLSGLVVGLGLPESAGTSVEAFLQAIGAQAAAGEPVQGERMEMDE